MWLDSAENNNMRLRGTAADVIIQQVAARQYWVVSRRQLIGAGLTSDSVDPDCCSRCSAESIASDTKRSPGGRELAAALACGDAAFVSHRSAAGRWRLLAPPAAGELVEVIARETDRGRKLDVRLRRMRTLRSHECTWLDGIPITTVPRALLDLARLAAVADAMLAIRDVDRAVNEAFARRLATHAAMNRVLDDRPRQPGSGLLRDILGARAGATRSEAERRLLELLRKAQLPGPEVNASFNGCEIDFLWRDRRLAVEVDGLTFHSTAGRFESDRRRDAGLAGPGFRVYSARPRRRALAMRVSSGRSRHTSHAPTPMSTYSVVQTGPKIQPGGAHSGRASVA